MTDFQRTIISLMKCAIVPEKTAVPPDFDWDLAIRYGKVSKIISLLYYGVQNSGCPVPDDIRNQLEIESFKYTIIDRNQLINANKIFRAFDENGIDYLPMKGIILKHFYPCTDMRIMGDADILIHKDQYQNIVPLMQELGFTETCVSDPELVWDKKGALHVELHTQPFAHTQTDFAVFYGDGWQFAHPVPDRSHRFVFSDEDTFVYLFAHFTKHYRAAGIGTRHMMDLWVYQQNHSNMDNALIKQKLVELDLFEFYCNISATLSVWFEDKPTTETTDLITDTLFLRGSFGGWDSFAVSEALKTVREDQDTNSVRFRRIIHLIFPPYNTLRDRYGIIRSPLLLPLGWIIRWLDILFFKLDEFKNVRRDLRVASPRNVAIFRRQLRDVGLKPFK